MTPKNTARAQSPLTGASAFWVSAYILSLVSLIWIGVWSYFNNNLRGAIIAMIFLMMLLASAVLSRNTLYQSGSFRQSATSFTFGFVLWSFLANNNQLSVSSNHLFSSIAGELPEMLEFMVNTFLVPIAEESLWMIAIPDTLAFLMDEAAKAKRFSFFGNKVFQLVVIAVVASVTFALFHVGNLAFASFIIAAIIFRVAMIFFVVGDQLWDVVPALNNVPAFAVGAHIANNLVAFGFGNGVLLLWQNLAVGWIIFAVFAILFLTAIDGLLAWVFRLWDGSPSPKD